MFDHNGEDDNSSNFKLGVIGITIIFVILMIVGIKCAYRIGPGFAGVLYNVDGGIEGNTLNQGWHIVLPWKSVTEYPISTETVYYTSNDPEENGKDTSVDANTKDGKKLNMSVTYAYHMSQEELPQLFTNFRGQPYKALEEGIMKNIMMQSITEVTSQFNLLEVTGDKLPEVNAKIFEAFSKGLASNGIILETFTLVPNPDEATKAAIQKVLDAQNALAQAKVEKEQAEINAEKARVEAKGRADARLIEAESQAQANQKLRESLSDEVIRSEYIKKWDGKLPQFMGTENSILVDPSK